MKYQKSIDALFDAIGGKDNIKNFEHCATRLRIILKDDSKLDKEKAENIPESRGYFYNTGQHQFIYGTGKVNAVYSELQQVMGDTSDDNSGNFKEDVYKNLNPVQRVVRVLADILVPLIPALVTTGLLMGIRGLLIELGMTLDENTFALFQMLTDTAFAFLPVLIAYSATRKFGGNPILGIVVGLMLVSPQLPNAWDVAGGTAEPLTIFGLDIIGYQGSIFPAIIVGWMVSRLEVWFRKFVPQIMDLIVTPFLTITITLAVMLFALGPVLQVVETTVINSLVYLIEAPLGIGYIIFGAVQQLIVITGLHHSIGIVEIGLLNSTGENVIQTLTTVSMAGQFGAAISAAFLFKDKVKKSNAISSAVPTLFGITEPLLFGVNLRAMRVFGSGMAAGAIGGFVVYLLNLTSTGMGITFVPGLLLYTGDMTALIQYIAVILISFAVGFVLVRIQGSKIRESFK
ncbi:MAG: PTS transporter subunit EIIC [Alkalibacterium gilvum]|uniref:PTS system, sucrose-specific IIC component n=1 Tax=Alkalibacterium gilvum TaxID=1130080 RepID=A0A1H6V5Q2_9LACT|nr:MULTISPECIES: PTS transporter subunit EIIC [Alkalibacterium]MDN6193589.1 PTS transporter subunit EIIC [Alkalibacterium sp.]MDN6293721.1 PTS transporter subunit EIIC [Alkalibacterium sp.]MDN6295431.1 PTS transporter subunit EIIC [Alkalibacterium sp.]MDN6398016.1 PTS transporter subunit EIIC [Alkalibacterium sp.]MDN6729913.1 PTS transporter subunit EIIC [Alkalibacterium sp.]